MKEIIRMVVVLTLICLVAAVALAQIYELTKGPIENAMRQEKLTALKAVLPTYDNEPDLDTVEFSGTTYYVAKKDGAVVGYAVEAVSLNGYSGEIKILLGLLPGGEVSGLEILEHKETPGLGQKIEEKSWRNQFIWKDSAKTTRRSLTNTNWAVKKDRGDIDQISGATISPRAVVEAVKGALDQFKLAQSRLAPPPPEPEPIVVDPPAASNDASAISDKNDTEPNMGAANEMPSDKEEKP